MNFYPGNLFYSMATERQILAFKCKKFLTAFYYSLFTLFAEILICLSTGQIVTLFFRYMLRIRMMRTLK